MLARGDAADAGFGAAGCGVAAEGDGWHGAGIEGDQGGGGGGHKGR